METYGLVGKRLEHSFSPDYFRKKFQELNLDAQYGLFEMDDLSSLPGLITEHPNLKGLNVTIPFKKEVIPYLDRLNETAHETGAVNTIKITRPYGKPVLKGYNTDTTGFEYALKPLLQGRRIGRALILGTGGGARSVAFVLGKMNIIPIFVSRNGKPPLLDYRDLNIEIVSTSLLIVNTTPLGMYPDVDDCPAIPYDCITKDHLFFDLIYNPAETMFLKKARRQGAATSNGMKMLEIQAHEAWKIWQG